ncbi:NADH dehydrogenase (ubiquinone) subunit ND-42 [Andrena cerasifolii]|uniref:NADH dehydrogenase (ubiquinone) subunit ND-42 n=1 Tax=Andrena cerasifolii TaxID=2819439 RepID=UPI004037FA39
MASIFSVGVRKVSTVGCLTRLCKISKNHNATQVAFMVRLAHQEPRKKPAPFPYWKKKYNMFYQLIDPMTYRFDENTRIMVVDGLPAVGKSKLCKQLANEFGLLYMPAPAHEEYYVNSYGFDTRQLDPQLPSLARSYDLERFHQNPTDKRVAFFQLLYFLMRFEQYANSLLHLLSTGQGVILDRSVYSNFVFGTAMVNAGYISKDTLNVITHMTNKGMQYLLRPHLSIYLDVPLELVKEKIKERGVPYEVNSKAFTPSYLADLEKIYKDRYLKETAHSSHLLIYDWSKEGNVEDIVEDIEALDFDNEVDGKLTDWTFASISDVVSHRRTYDENMSQLYNEMYRDDERVNWPRELYLTAEEQETVDNVFETCASEAFASGYNPYVGDSVYFKSPGVVNTGIRRNPRDFENRTSIAA